MPTNEIRLISVSDPSLRLNTTSTRFCDRRMICGVTLAAKCPLAAYASMIFSRSSSAISVVNTARGRSVRLVRSLSSVIEWLPSKTIRLTIGFSTTCTTSVLPSRDSETSLNSPVA